MNIDHWNLVWHSTSNLPKYDEFKLKIGVVHVHVYLKILKHSLKKCTLRLLKIIIYQKCIYTCVRD